MAGHPQIHWTHWIQFLEVLSVERTAQFIHELQLPFAIESHPQVRRLARACLEAYMFRAVRAAGREEQHSTVLSQTWQRYRSAEGVLSDAELINYSHVGLKPDVIAQRVFDDLSEWIGRTLAGDLKVWFVDRFWLGEDIGWDWVLAVERIASSPANGWLMVVADGANQEVMQELASFSRRVRVLSRELEQRFFDVRRMAHASSPSLWEEVLQELPAEGLGNDFPWLSHIERCLNKHIIRTEWSRTRARLGSDAISRIGQLVQDTSRQVSIFGNVPSEPQPIATGQWSGTE